MGPDGGAGVAAGVGAEGASTEDVLPGATLVGERVVRGEGTLGTVPGVEGVLEAMGAPRAGVLPSLGRPGADLPGSAGRDVMPGAGLPGLPAAEGPREVDEPGGPGSDAEGGLGVSDEGPRPAGAGLEAEGPPSAFV